MRFRVPALKGHDARALIERRCGAPHELVEKDEDDRSDGDDDRHRQSPGEREAPGTTQHAEPQPGVEGEAP